MPSIHNRALDPWLARNRRASVKPVVNPWRWCRDMARSLLVLVSRKLHQAEEKTKLDIAVSEDQRELPLGEVLLTVCDVDVAMTSCNLYIIYILLHISY